MSDFITNDPILLAALQATESVTPAGTRSRGSSQYRGVSKNSNARSNTWSAATETGGKSYNLGTYRTEEEAALARNYGDELLRHPRPVRNIIPPESMPDEIIQARVARTVVMVLRRKGIALPTASADGRKAAEADGSDSSAGHQPEPATRREAPSESSPESSAESSSEIESEQEAVAAKPTMSEYEQKIQRLIDNP